MKKANFESGRFFSEEQIFFDKRHCPAGRSSTVNWHDYIEIIYFLDGEGSAFLEDRQYSILPETLIAVGPQTIHSITGKTEMPYYIIFIHQSFFLQNGIDPEALKLPEYTVNDQKLKDIFAELYEASRSDSFRQAKINSACLKLIFFIAKPLQIDTAKASIDKPTANRNRVNKSIFFSSVYHTVWGQTKKVQPRYTFKIKNNKFMGFRYSVISTFQRLPYMSLIH